MRRKGFTLIEVMVVMAIIAVLAVLIIGAISLARRTASETTNRSNAKTIQTALEAVFVKNKVYCTTPGTTITPACGAVTTAALATSFIAAIQSPTLATTCDDKAATTMAGNYIFKGVEVTALTPTTYTIYPVDYSCKDSLTSDKVEIL